MLKLEKEDANMNTKPGIDGTEFEVELKKEYFQSNEKITAVITEVVDSDDNSITYKLEYNIDELPEELKEKFKLLWLECMTTMNVEIKSTE